jgi:hypothetical protein
MGTMVARNWIDRTAVEAALCSACETNGLLHEGPHGVRATIRSGMTAGLKEPHRDLEERTSGKVVISDSMNDSSTIATSPDGMRGDVKIGEALRNQVMAPPLVPVIAEHGNGSATPTMLPVVWDGELDFVPPAWLVRDLIPERSVVLMIGESGAGKSFTAVDLTFALALGTPFFGKETKKGGVLFVAAEAAGTIPERARATRIRRAYPLLPTLRETRPGDILDAEHLAIAFIETVPDLAIEAGAVRLIATAREVGELMMRRHGVPLRGVVIDTMLASFALNNWNDQSDAAKAMTLLSRITRETGAATIGVHHLGKDITKGAARPDRVRTSAPL